MGEEFIQIHTTTSSREEAQKIAEAVVSRRLAAACWISSSITGIYWWKGKVEQEEAWVCLMKTRKGLFERIAQTIREIHSYELPAIVATPMLIANDGYFDWIVAETTQ
jgi:periplasmic divalent cation tolerance protein